MFKNINKNKYLSLISLAMLTLMLGGCDKPVETAPQPQARTEGESVIIPSGAQQTTSLKSLVINMQPVPPTHLNGRVVWDEDKTVRIYTPFAGRVERILVQAGQSVARGQALAVIASPDFGQAQTDARRAESDFALTEKISRVCASSNKTALRRSRTCMPSRPIRRAPPPNWRARAAGWNSTAGAGAASIRRTP